MGSCQIGIDREDAETILKIVKKYTDIEASCIDFDIDEDGNEIPLTPLYDDVRIQICYFDEKNEEEILNKMYIQTDTNR